MVIEIDDAVNNVLVHIKWFLSIGVSFGLWRMESSSIAHPQQFPKFINAMEDEPESSAILNQGTKHWRSDKRTNSSSPPSHNNLQTQSCQIFHMTAGYSISTVNGRYTWSRVGQK